MPQAFFSHSTKDKKIVLQAAEYLNHSLVKTWVDQSQLPVGASMAEMIASGIRRSRYFFAFVSQNYLDSDWCLDELRQVYSLFLKNQVRLIPVLLAPHNQLDLSKLSTERRDFLEAILRDTKYVEFDTHDPQKSVKAVADSLWQYEDIRIEPVRVLTLDGVGFQEIKFVLQKKELPSDFLQHWDVDMNDFIADSVTDPKPIRFGLPVALSGISINWLITFLSMPFKNRRTVFVYNHFTRDYVCVFTLKDDHFVGKVLK